MQYRGACGECEIGPEAAKSRSARAIKQFVLRRSDVCHPRIEQIYTLYIFGAILRANLAPGLNEARANI